MIGLLLTLALTATPALPALRSDHQAAERSVADIDQKIQLQQGQLEQVSQQIDGFKRGGPSGPFVPGALDEALRKSQVLSDQLDRLRTRRSSLADHLASSRAALYQGLEQEIGDERAAAESTEDLGQRTSLLDTLRQLESERASLAPQLKTSPEIRLSAKPTDDPRELHERADALRDRADRLARELTLVNGRIQELRDEADLDRELRTLNRDQGLFDEGDQRVRSSHTDPLAAPAAVQASSRSPSGLGATTAVTGLPPPTSPTQTTGSHLGTGVTIGGTGLTGAASSTPSSGALPSGAHIDGAPSSSPTPAQLSEPRIGELVQVDALSTASLPDDASLDALVARSQSLAKERASLEAKARQLDSAAAP